MVIEHVQPFPDGKFVDPAPVCCLCGTCSRGRIRRSSTNSCPLHLLLWSSTSPAPTVAHAASVSLMTAPATVATQSVATVPIAFSNSVANDVLWAAHCFRSSSFPMCGDPDSFCNADRLRRVRHFPMLIETDQRHSFFIPPSKKGVDDFLKRYRRRAQTLQAVTCPRR